MAFVKHCDNPTCGKKLGGSLSKPFIQVKQSRTDQIEGPNGEVKFRYLTDYGERERIYTYCDDFCEQAWKDEKRAQKSWELPGGDNSYKRY